MATRFRESVKAQVKNMLPRSEAKHRLHTCPWDGCRRSRKEVSRVSNIEISALAASKWQSQLGASVLPMSLSATGLQGARMSGAGFGTGPCVVATLAVRRHRDEVAFTGVSAPVGIPALAELAPAGVPVPTAAPAPGAGQLGQLENSRKHNSKQYVTSVNVDGVGAAGPPRRRGPA